MKKIILIGIIVLSAFLRLYKLDSYPALNADEAAIGYNAYSLLQTGKDEHGNPWPIHFQSFNDYKPGLYVYVVMPFVKIFGLNEWAVRLPNALFGVSSVFVLYLLIKELNIRNSLKFENSKLEILAPAMLAASPWHIHFSRGGWEANTATFLILFGVYLFVKGLNNKAYLFLSSLVFTLSLYTYHSARIITPLLVIGMIVIYWGELKRNIKPLLLSGVLAIVILLPLLLDLTKSGIISRASGVGLIADTGPIERTNEQRMEHKGITSLVLHNKLTNYGLAFIKNWGAHYHGLFLFISGDDIQRNRVPETGQMYMFEVITVLFGIYFIFRSYSYLPSTKIHLLILYWLLIAPIPAALTFQSPHALRSQNMVIPLTLVSAIGFSKILNFLGSQKRIIRMSGYVIASIVIFWSFSRYLHMYYTHMSREYPFSSQYGVKELVSYIGSDKRSYKNIVISDKYDQPYILFLFYTRYSPVDFQKDHVLTARDKYGFSTVNSYSNYIFKPINWDRDKLQFADSLIIGSNEEIPDETNITKRIYGSNGFLYFKVVEN